VGGGGEHQPYRVSCVLGYSGKCGEEVGGSTDVDLEVLGWVVERIADAGKAGEMADAIELAVSNQLAELVLVEEISDPHPASTDRSARRRGCRLRITTWWPASTNRIATAPPT
jgi:hypothetical protein